MPRGNPPSDRGRPIVIGCHCHNLRDCPGRPVFSRRQRSTFKSVRRTGNRVANVQQARSVVVRACAHVRTSTPFRCERAWPFRGVTPRAKWRSFSSSAGRKRTPKPCATLKTFARAVVLDDVPCGAVVAGNPARVVRRRSSRTSPARVIRALREHHRGCLSRSASFRPSTSSEPASVLPS